MQLILASASRRRQELLRQAGIVPDAIRSPDIDETPISGEKPREYCRRMAKNKSLAVKVGEGELVLSADTIVAVGRTIIGKPDSAANAESILKMLSGRRHKVITAIVVRTVEKMWCKDVQTILKMNTLTSAEIESYIESREWVGKAGAYGIQGRAGAFIPWLRGSFTAVVGLPLAETTGLLRASGYCAKSQ